MAEFLAGALVSSMRQFVLARHRPPPDVVAAELERYIDAVLDTVPKQPIPTRSTRR